MDIPSTTILLQAIADWAAEDKETREPIIRRSSILGSAERKWVLAAMGCEEPGPANPPTPDAPHQPPAQSASIDATHVGAEGGDV